MIDCNIDFYNHMAGVPRYPPLLLFVHAGEGQGEGSLSFGGYCFEFRFGHYNLYSLRSQCPQPHL